MSSLGRQLMLLTILAIVGGALFVQKNPDLLSKDDVAYHTISPSQPAATGQSLVISSTTLATSSTQIAITTNAKPSKPNKPIIKATKSVSTSIVGSSPQTVSRIQNPYPFPPLTFDQLNTGVRGALVNILCMPYSGTLRPISGSGIIIDPRGVILTNAHVAQYVLLSESSRIDLTCQIRAGSPAAPTWKAAVLYIPPTWVSEHVSEISSQNPTGTGEHDYSLLLITGSFDGKGSSAPYPFISVDTRPAIGFEGDQVLAAAYPAEFLGSAAEYSLYAVSSITTIQKMLTFTSSSVDVVSLGGLILAQSGSSGGPVVNQWGKLIGLIVTTSAGVTTGDRDLHAITTDYINRDISAQTTHSLDDILAGDVIDEATDFSTSVVPQLLQKYIDVLTLKSQ